MESRQRGWSPKALILIGLLLVSFVGRIASLSVTVNDIECVYEYVIYEGDTVSGNFVVVDHDIFWATDHPGLDLIVTSPGGNTVHTSKGTSGEKFEFKAPRSGMYKFCFHNPYSTPETVSFNIHVGHIPTEHDIAKDEHLDPINARDARHRHTNESTRKRVVFYTVGEYIMLAAASALQVVYIRRLFSKSIGYNRV
ncbi:hypothetical protein M0R45_018229 [Rubus argutus]|uniref:GOLD domain-containing protein n=1 Tax=Rubus argutus TaxID=59490 RepID=A0AAW1X2U8_RUBAR